MVTRPPCCQVCLVRLTASEPSAFQVHGASLAGLLSENKVPRAAGMPAVPQMDLGEGMWAKRRPWMAAAPLSS